jgi:hypothetical protein
MSADYDQVAFTDSVGADLQVEDFGSQSDGQALGVFIDDDNSELIMDFTESMYAISLDFGNDNPCCSSPGDEAVLTLYDGGVQIAQVSEEMNRNDLMDQNIAYNGASGCFDQRPSSTT